MPDWAVRIAPGHHLPVLSMKPHYCLSYEDLQTEISNAQDLHLRARQQFKKLVRATRRLFRTKRCKVQLPLEGPLVLRACFAHRYQVPAWSLAQCLAHDFLYRLPASFLVSTHLDHWTPDGEREYFFEVCLELPPSSPN